MSVTALVYFDAAALQAHHHLQRDYDPRHAHDRTVHLGLRTADRNGSVSFSGSLEESRALIAQMTDQLDAAEAALAGHRPSAPSASEPKDQP